MATNQAAIISACETYLSDGVSSGAPLAVWLNDASTAEATTDLSPVMGVLLAGCAE